MFVPRPKKCFAVWKKYWASRNTQERVRVGEWDLIEEIRKSKNFQKNVEAHRRRKSAFTLTDRNGEYGYVGLEFRGCLNQNMLVAKIGFE